MDAREQTQQHVFFNVILFIYRSGCPSVAR